MGWLLILVITLAIFWHFQPVATGLMLAIGVVVILVVEYATRKSDDKIVSAKVVERTQIMKEECTPSGFSLGYRCGHRMYWRFKQAPSHIEVKVAVVYEDGKHSVLTLTEGSGRYARIAAICEKCESVPTKDAPQIDVSPKTSTSDVNYIDVKTNQLVAGVYVIGDTIPEGNYDLKWIWGSGSVQKYVDNTTLLGASNLFQWVGNTHDYEQQVLVNVVCKSGEHLHVDGNLIVEIRRSKSVVLDL